MAELELLGPLGEQMPKSPYEVTVRVVVPEDGSGWRIELLLTGSDHSRLLTLTDHEAVKLTKAANDAQRAGSIGDPAQWAAAVSRYAGEP